MKILVTGSDGYIGSVLVQRLISEGMEVIGLDAGFYRSGWLYNGVEITPLTITKDIRKLTQKDFKGFDVVIHLAELSNDPLGEINQDITYKINHEGSVKLAEMAKTAGVKRFVYTSSCSVYGASDNVSSEESPTNPQTLYAKCKVLNEGPILDLGDDNFTAVVLRNATVFGPSPRMRFDIAINNLCAVAYTTGVIKMDSNGKAWRPFVHIEDVARAIKTVLNAPKEVINKQIFNVGSKDSNYQIREIANIIHSELPKCEITINEQNADTRNYRVSFDKILTTLKDYKPSVTVRDGVKELISLFKAIDLKKEDFESPSFTRIKKIKSLLDTKQIDKDFYWNLK